jgi:hypothetical protein
MYHTSARGYRSSVRLWRPSAVCTRCPGVAQVMVIDMLEDRLELASDVATAVRVPTPRIDGPAPRCVTVL